MNSVDNPANSVDNPVITREVGTSILIEGLVKDSIEFFANAAKPLIDFFDLVVSLCH